MRVKMHVQVVDAHPFPKIALPFALPVAFQAPFALVFGG